MLRSLKSNKREGRYVAGPALTRGLRQSFSIRLLRFLPLLSLVSFIHEHVIEVDGPADSLAGVFAALFTVNRVTTSGG